MTDALTDVLKPAEVTSENILETLVGEGRKYKSVEDLAKAYIHADRHIHDLEDEREEQRQHSSTMEEVLAELRKTAKKPTDDDLGTVPPSNPVTVEKVEPKDVDALIAQRLEEHERAQRFAENTRRLATMLEQEYGGQNEAASAVKAFINGKDHIKQTINQLGGTDPDEAFAMIKARVQKEVVVPNAPGIGGQPSAGASIPSVSGLTWTQARELRKKDPKTYQSREFQAKLEQAIVNAQKSGIDFFKS